VAVIRCAKTPTAVPVATLDWNKPVTGSLPTIHAGDAVAFLTNEPMAPTVTEGENGVAASHACVDQTLTKDVPLVVTFYEPGDYHIFCRKDPTTMKTVVHVT
jgi:plastocyanin